MIQMRFEGGAELAATLASLPASVSKAIKREVLTEAAEPMVAVARSKAPRGPDAPHLADNIEIGTPRQGIDKFGDAYAEVAMGPVKGFSDVGFWQEFGTVHHGAQPFMRPAFDTQRERSLGIVRTRLWEHIRSYVVKLRGGPS